MATPVKFNQTNFDWQKPEGMTDAECSSLPAHLDQQAGTSLSCWQLSPEEIQEVKKTGKVWLSVVGAQPPVSVSGFEGEVKAHPGSFTQDTVDEVVRRLGMTRACAFLCECADNGLDPLRTLDEVNGKPHG